MFPGKCSFQRKYSDLTVAGLDKDAELAGEDKQNAETVIVTAVEKIAALIRRQDGREHECLLFIGGKL